jgi:hypothetical protein
VSTNEVPLYSSFQCSNVPVTMRVNLFRAMKQYGIKKNYVYCRLSKHSHAVKKTVIFDLDTLLDVKDAYIADGKKTRFIDKVINVYNGDFIESRKKRYNLEECSFYIGKSKAFFSQKKSKEPDLFRYLCFLGKGNPAIGYSKFPIAIDKQIDELCEHMLQFKNRWLGAGYLYEQGFYGSQYSANEMLVRLETIGCNSTQVEWGFFKRIRNINKHFRRKNEQSKEQ